MSSLFGITYTQTTTSPTRTISRTTSPTRSASPVGESVFGQQEQAGAPVPGVVPFVFYKTDNSSGQMLRPGAAAAISVTLPYRGSIVGLAAGASGADTGTYTVHVDGDATEAAIALSAGTSTYQTWEKSTFEVADGSTIDVRATSVSGTNAIEVIVYVAIEPSTVL